MIKKIIISCMIINSLMAIRPSSYPFIAGDTFRTFCKHHMDEDNVVNASEIKYADTVYLRVNEPERVVTFFTHIFPKIKNPFILVTHDGDWSIPGYSCYLEGSYGFDLTSYLNNNKIIAWFAQNIDTIHPKLKPLPIGFANSCWGHGKVNNFLQVHQNIPSLDEKKELIYLNFTLGTNKIRKPLINHYKNFKFCFSSSSKPHVQYLEEMKEYRYILCPPGNGQDCHRVWEALLVGSIAIIEHSALDSLFEDLPVIFVNDWFTIDLNFLNKKYQELKNKKFKREKLYAQYWLDQIQQIQNEALLNS